MVIFILKTTSMKQESIMNLFYKVRQTDRDGIVYLIIKDQSWFDSYMEFRIRKYPNNVVDYHAKAVITIPMLLPN